MHIGSRIHKLQTITYNTDIFEVWENYMDNTGQGYWHAINIWSSVLELESLCCIMPSLVICHMKWLAFSHCRKSCDSNEFDTPDPTTCDSANAGVDRFNMNPINFSGQSELYRDTVTICPLRSVMYISLLCLSYYKTPHRGSTSQYIVL